jgi:hypothetical protein
MRRLYRSLTTATLLTGLALGCGSSANDTVASGSGGGPQPGLVMRFVSFDVTNIEQQDLVTPTSAQVDVVPSCCTTDFLFTTVTFEAFTETTINVIFQDEEKSDILLNSYTIHFDDSSLGLGDIHFNVSALLQGRRCSNDTQRACTIDADCIIPGQLGSGATCDANQTLVSGLLLFDFLTKQLLSGNPKLLGQATTVTISFFGTDQRNRTFLAQTAYVVTFDNFCNCDAGTFCVPTGAIPGC